MMATRRRWRWRRVALAAAAVLVAAAGLGANGLISGRSVDVGRIVGGVYEVEVHRDGRPIAKSTFAAGSPEAGRVDRWLRAHDSGWRLDINTYAPNRIVRAERFHLDFWDRKATLNYRAGRAVDRWLQVTRPIEPGDVPDVLGPPPAR